MASANGLYFPFMRVRDLAWLKASVLYWDTIWRFGPEAYPIQDGAETRVLVDERVVRSLRPESYTPETAAQLLGFMEEHRGLLRQQYFIGDRAPETDRPDWGSDRPEGPNDGPAWIHASKMSDEFHRFMQDEGLARVGRGEDTQWVGVHETVAMAYMMALTSAGAGANRLEPITDVRDRALLPASGVEAAMRLMLGEPETGPGQPDHDCASFAMLVTGTRS